MPHMPFEERPGVHPHAFLPIYDFDVSSKFAINAMSRIDAELFLRPSSSGDCAAGSVGQLFACLTVNTFNAPNHWHPAAIVCHWYHQDTLVRALDVFHQSWCDSLNGMKTTLLKVWLDSYYQAPLR